MLPALLRSFGHGTRQLRKCSTLSNRDFLAQFKGGSVDLNKDVDSGIATVTINNPDRHNAMTGEMMVQLEDVVTDLECWAKGKAVVLHGAGGSLCSGGDLKTVIAIMDPVKGGRMSAHMQKTLNRLYCLPLLSVAIVQGHTLGGGAELSTACDFRVMDRNAKIGFVQSRMGVTPGWGGGMRLVQLVGRNGAMDLLVSGRVLGAEEALKLNLACEVMDFKDAESGVEDTVAWLKERVRGDPAVVQAAKKVVLNGMYMHNEVLLQGERDIFTSVWGGPAHQAAASSKIKHK